MRSPAAAMAWELGRRHRWGLAAIALYVIALAAGRAFFLDPSTPVVLEDNDLFVFSIVMPLTMAYFYLLVMFCFGLSGDIAARESLYPTRLFTLPVTTTALVFWPMLYGMLIMAALWVAVTVLTLRPAGLNFPLWPAVFAAVFLGWAQTLMWRPYPWRHLRLIASVALLISIDLVVIVAINYRIPEGAMLAALAPQLPLTFILARRGVTRARRGDHPEWTPRRAVTGAARVSAARPFSSAARAQFWFEWRQHGWALPILVAAVVPVELALLFLPGGNERGIVFYTLIPVAFTPRMMAAFASLTIRTPNPDGGDPHALAPFMATRPASSAMLVAAKLQTTFVSTALAWSFVVFAAWLGLWLAGAWPVIDEALDSLSAIIGRPRAIALVVIVLAWLALTTWKQLVQGLCIGLTGREWLIRANSALVVAVTVCIFPTLDWLVDDREFREAAWDALPWILGLLVTVKMMLAAWVAARLVATRQFRDRLLIAGAGAWTVTVFAIYAGLALLFATPQLPRHYFALLAILTVPLGRLSAAPLALAWNRHR